MEGTLAQRQLRRSANHAIHGSRVSRFCKWTIIFARASDACPTWYAESLEKDDREYWDGCFGDGFYDWYLEMLIESAYRDPEPPRQERARERVIQPLLPGLSSLSLGNYYGLE